GTKTEEFAGLNEMTLGTTDPIVKAALVCLAEAWPGAVAFEEVLRRARRRLEAAGDPPREPSDEDRFLVGKAALTAYAGGSDNLMELWLRPPQFTTTVSERPVASPLARLQAANGLMVSTLR